MKQKFLWIFFFLGSLAITALGAEPASLGVLEFSGEGIVTLIRGEKILEITQSGTAVEKGDLVESPQFAVTLRLNSGDLLLMAPYSSLKVEPKAEKFEFDIKGKVRAQVVKGSRQRFFLRTANAQIGVRGTDFVAEFRQSRTRVATLEGLVQLESSQNGQSLDVPPGKMGTVSPAGALLPLEEIAGEMLSGVEIGGKRLSTDEAGGARIRD